MTKFEYLNQNIFKIKWEVRKGIIPNSIIRHYSIYSRFDYYRKLNNKVSISVFYTSEDFKVTEKCVYKIKKDMESDI